MSDTLTLESAHAYAAKVGLLALLGAHSEGLQMVLTSYGQALPESITADVWNHFQTTTRLIKAIEATVGDDE